MQKKARVARKNVKILLRNPKCDPKLGIPKISVGDLFCMAGDPLKNKSLHIPKIKRVTGSLLFRAQEATSSFFAKFAWKIKLLQQWPKMAVYFAKLHPPCRKAYQLPYKSGSVRIVKCHPFRS